MADPSLERRPHIRRATAHAAPSPPAIPDPNRDHPQVALASLMLPHPFLAAGKHPYRRNRRFPNAPLLQLATRDLGQQLEQVQGAICIAIDSNE